MSASGAGTGGQPLTAPPTRKPTFAELCEQYKKVLDPYLGYLVRTNKTLDPRGMGKDMRQGALELDEVYVSLAVERSARQEWAADLRDGLGEEENVAGQEEDAERQTEREEEARQLAELRRRRESALSQTERLSLDRAVREQERAAIVGDPGSGKTTLLRFLARHFAQACQQNASRVTDKEGTDYGATRLPIFVRISRYAEAFHTNKNLKLAAYLPCAFGDVQVASEKLQECFTAFLQAGYGLVLLDGLDEVIDSGDRALIAREIDGFSAGAGANRLLVTSRIAGYRAAPLGAAFTEFHLLDMDAEQRKQFLKGYLPAYERSLHPEHSPEQIAEAARKAQESIETAIEKNVGVRRLARNPLLLTILALVQRTKAHLPHQRVELYRVASEILLSDWQQGRDVPSDKCIEDTEALAMFGPVALWLHTERPSGMAPLRDVKDQFAKTLAAERGKKPNDREIQRDVSLFLERARELTGLFVERAPGYYGFLHLTFEEYFVARQMVAEDETLPAFIHSHRHRPRWEEPILLAISYESRDRPKRATRLIRTAILGQSIGEEPSAFPPDKDEALLHRDLLLAAQCVGDCRNVERALSQEVGERIANLYLDLVQQVRFAPLQMMLLERMAYLNGSTAGEAMALRLVPALQDRNASVRSSLAVALGRQSVLPEAALTALVALLKDWNADVRISAAAALGRQPALPEAALTALVVLLQFERGYVRGRAAEALLQVGQHTDVALTALVALLQHGNSDVLYRAAEALLQVGQHTDVALTALVALLRDKDAIVRGRAVEALGRQSVLPEAALTALVDLLGDMDADVRYMSAEALLQVGQHTDVALTALVALLRDGNGYARYMAAEALGRQSVLPEVALTALVALLKDWSADVRYMSAEALLQVGQHTDVALTALVALLKDWNADVRYMAAETLLQVGQHTDVALTALVALLQHGNSDVRDRAAVALGRQSVLPEAALTALVDLLGDMDADVRISAAEALLQVGQHTDVALTALVARLRDWNEYVRYMAAAALGRYGASSQNELQFAQRERYAQALREMLNAPNTDGNIDGSNYPRVHDFAWEALWRIRARLDQREP